MLRCVGVVKQLCFADRLCGVGYHAFAHDTFAATPRARPRTPHNTLHPHVSQPTSHHTDTFEEFCDLDELPEEFGGNLVLEGGARWGSQYEKDFKQFVYELNAKHGMTPPYDGSNPENAAVAERAVAAAAAAEN